MAPIMTNAREISQLPKTSRKPLTFSGFVIPEIDSPAANMTPETKLMIIDFTSRLLLFLQLAYLR